jgi:hypothetical protein
MAKSERSVRRRRPIISETPGWFLVDTTNHSHYFLGLSSLCGARRWRNLSPEPPGGAFFRCLICKLLLEKGHTP